MILALPNNVLPAVLDLDIPPSADFIIVLSIYVSTNLLPISVLSIPVDAPVSYIRSIVLLFFCL
jgi:hypothetical protein